MHLIKEAYFSDEDDRCFFVKYGKKMFDDLHDSPELKTHLKRKLGTTSTKDLLSWLDLCLGPPPKSF